LPLLVVALIALSGLGLGGVLIFDVITQARVHATLQKAADDAAISGVLALASERDPAAAQHDATATAAREVANRFPGAQITVNSSSSDLKTSVEIAAPASPRLLGFLHSGSQIDVSSTASYLPPAQNQEPLPDRLHWRDYAHWRQ
jgi:hypothetical protein